MNGSRQILSVPAIDILRATTRLLINDSNHNVKHHATYLLSLLAGSKQHTNVEERTEIKDSQSYSFDREIDFLTTIGSNIITSKSNCFFIIVLFLDSIVSLLSKHKKKTWTIYFVYVI